MDCDMGYDPAGLECPWCGQTNIIDYEDFGSDNSNGATSETECHKCEKPLITEVQFEFWIRKDAR